MQSSCIYIHVDDLEQKCHFEQLSFKDPYISLKNSGVLKNFNRKYLT
jgi:hypothetical protein